MFFFVEAQKLSHQPGNLLGPINCPKTSLARKLCYPPKYALVVRWKKNIGVFATGSTFWKDLTPSSLTHHVPLGVFSCSTAELRDLLTIQIQPLGWVLEYFQAYKKNWAIAATRSCNNFGEFMVFTKSSKGSPTQKRSIMLFWGLHNPRSSLLSISHPPPAPPLSNPRPVVGVPTFSRLPSHRLGNKPTAVIAVGNRPIRSE